MNDLARIERLDDEFPDFFRRISRQLQLPGDAPAEIKLDVTENDKDYQVRAVVPGVKKEDIRVSVDGNHVSISAEVRRDKEEKSGRSLLAAAARRAALTAIKGRRCGFDRLCAARHRGNPLSPRRCRCR